MKQRIFDKLLENSLKNKTKLTESIDNNTYEVMVGNILADRIKTFIAYDICDVQPMSSPAGFVFARKADKDAQSFEIIKSNVETNTYKQLWKITDEALDDLQAISGNTELFTDIVKSSAAFDETKDFLKYITEQAVDAGTFTQPADSANNAEVALFSLVKYIGEKVIKINETFFRSYDGFCILPQKYADPILTLSFTYSRWDDSDDKNKPCDYFLGKINNIKFYIHPDPKAEDCVVGIKSKSDKGVSSIIYTPYDVIITKAANSEDGVKTFGVFLRNGFVVNPLHTKEAPLLYKFKIK